MRKDDFGDRMKMYEGFETNRKLIPKLPICVRLDGRNFSKFTKGLKRPFDERLSSVMILLTKELINECNAIIGYTQSDEISLIIHSDTIKSQVYFNGKIFKIISSLSSFASVRFNKLIQEYIPEKSHLNPTFDCRIWNVPNKEEAVNTLLWREQDATKNSISMSANHYYSNKELHGLNSKQKQEKIFQAGINWNDYPAFFKRGVFIKRKLVEKILTEDEINIILKDNPKYQIKDNKIKRHVYKILCLPPFSTIENRVGVIFNNEDPQINKN